MSDAFDVAWLILKYKDYGVHAGGKPPDLGHATGRPEEDWIREEYVPTSDTNEWWTGVPSGTQVKRRGGQQVREEMNRNWVKRMNFPSPHPRAGWNSEARRWPVSVMYNSPENKFGPTSESDEEDSMKEGLEIPMRQAVQEAIGRVVTPEERKRDHERATGEEYKENLGGIPNYGDWLTLPDEPYPDAGKGEFSEGEYLWPRGTPESMLPDQFKRLLEGNWKGWKEEGYQ